MSVEYNDFSGGKTDNVTSGNFTQGEIVENLRVTRDRKLETRSGFEVFDSHSTYESVVRASPQKIGELRSCINNTYLLIRKAADVYFKRLDNGNWQKVVSPNATQKAFWTALEHGVTRMVEWGGQVYGVAHNNPDNPGPADLLSPMRFYPDNKNPELIQVRNASAPQVPDPYASSAWFQHTLNLANEIRAKLLAHLSTTGPTWNAIAATDRIDTGLSNVPSYISDSDTYDLNLIYFEDSTAGGISADTPYYIRNVSGGTFQLSNTPTGPIIDITSNGTVKLGFHKTTPTITLPPPATDLQSLIQLTSSMVYYYNLHITNAYIPFNDPHEFKGGNFIISEESITGFRKCAEVLNHLKFAFNCHLLSFDPNNVSLRQHINVNFDTSVPANCSMVLTGYAFERNSNNPDLSVAGYLSGEISRETFTLPSELDFMITSAVSSYNSHVGSPLQHSQPDFKNRIKINWTYKFDPTYVKSLKDAQNFVSVFKLAYGMKSHRVKGSPIHGGSEPNSTDLGAVTKEIFEYGIVYEKTKLIQATTFQNIYNIVRDVLNKLAIHSLYTTGSRHLLSRSPSDLNLPKNTFYFSEVSYALTYITRQILKGNIRFESESNPIIIEGVKTKYTDGSYDNSTGAYTPGTINKTEGISKTIIFITSLNTIENQSSNETNLRTYRTIENGNVYYLVREGELATIDETTSDDVLQGNETIYTTGGVLGNDPAPRSKAFEIINNYGYYGGIVEKLDDGTEIFLPRRLRQSKASEIGACPESFYVDLESEIETIGRAGEYPIVVCREGVYRIEGAFDDQGFGGMVAKKISDKVGGVSINGGVTVNDIFYFAGNDGFYLATSTEVRNISPHLKETYKKYVTGNRKHYIQCKHDPVNNVILWAVRKADGGPEHELDTIVVLDPKFGAEGEACIYEWNGDSFRPTAIEHHNKQLVRGDIQGFTFKQTDILTDPKIDRTGSGSISGVEPIVYRFRTTAEYFENSTLRKWAARAYVVFEKLTTNLTSQLRSIVDLTESKIKNMKYVLHRSNTYEPGYSGSDIIPVKRTFPAKHLRSFYRQLEVTLGKKTDNSSTTNTATITGTNVVISSGTWPNDCNGKWITFSNDNYIEEFLIVSGQGTNTLVVATAPGNASGLSWGIRSYPTDEKTRILSVSIEGDITGNNLFPSKGNDGTSP